MTAERESRSGSISSGGGGEFSVAIEKFGDSLANHRQICWQIQISSCTHT